MYRNDNSVTMSVDHHRHGELRHRQRLAGDPTDDLVDRPVVQVHAVRPDADPQEHRVPEHRPGERATVRDCRDHEQRRDRREQETTAEQPRIRTFGRHEVQVPHLGAERHEPEDGEKVHQASLVAQRSAHDRVRPPHHRERRSEQQSARPCDRRQVQRIGLRDATVGDRPVRLRSDVALPDPTLVVQQRHRDRDHQGGDGEPFGHAEHTTCPDPQQHHHHQRPQQVELLLDGEAPEVAQRREVPGRAVSLPDPDLVPVRDVEQPAQHVATQFAERVRSEDRRVRDQHEHHHEQRREQPASTPHPEMPEMDAAGALLLGDQQQRDQVTADDEEDLHAQEPAGQPLTVGVVDHHRHDCERAHAVESREVRDTTDV